MRSLGGAKYAASKFGDFSSVKSDEKPRKKASKHSRKKSNSRSSSSSGSSSLSSEEGGENKHDKGGGKGNPKLDFHKWVASHPNSGYVCNRATDDGGAEEG